MHGWGQRWITSANQHATEIGHEGHGPHTPSRDGKGYGHAHTMRRDGTGDGQLSSMVLVLFLVWGGVLLFAHAIAPYLQFCQWGPHAIPPYMTGALSSEPSHKHGHQTGHHAWGVPSMHWEYQACMDARGPPPV